MTASKFTTTPSPIEVVEKVNAVIDDVSSKAAKTDAITGLSVSGKTVTYTKGNGSTGTITTQDTTYSSMSASEATTGTSTTARTITAKVLHDKINEQASSGSLPVGTIIPFSGSTVPTGYLTCNGAAVSRTTYADLFAIIGTTYGAGNGSTTFNLPNLNNNSFLEGSDTIGTVKSAGLPNITGSVAEAYNSTTPSIGWHNYQNKGYGNGALYLSGTSYSAAEVRSYGDGGSIMFDASLSNSIYGNSTTVQPKSVTVKYIIKAFSSITNAGNIDVQDLASDYERLNTEITNTKNSIPSISDYIVESYINGTNWYEIYKSGKVKQGGILNAGVTHTFLKPFKNTNYTLCAAVKGGSGSTSNINWTYGTANNKTATSFKAHQNGAGLEWIAVGQGA